MIACGGRDESADLGDQVRKEVDRMQALQRCAFIPSHISALRLREAPCETAFDLTFADLLRYRQHVDTRASALEARPGWRGFLSTTIRRVLWRLMRFQHERLFFRQNLINSHVAALLEMQGRHQAEAMAEMSARLETLERKTAGSSRAANPAGRPGSS